jgi:hypothetical protein
VARSALAAAPMVSPAANPTISRIVCLLIHGSSGLPMA